MPETIPTQTLREGDVLLYHGTSWVSKAIRLFDGTDVSHASLYLGHDEVGEALGEGLVRRDLASSIEGATYLWARRLKASDEMTPVLAAGRKYLDQGARYGYEQLVLLALLCLTRKVKVTPVLRFLLRGVLDRAAEALANLGDGRKEALICSEFVYRAYDEALPGSGDPYTIAVGAERGLTRELAPVQAGQGVHPESVLAWAASPASRSWASQNGSERSRAPSPSDRELERVFEQYEQEVRDPSSAPRSVAQPVSDHDLLDSVDRFAERYTRVALPPEDALLERDPRPTSRLVRAVADFVTPGDLLRTESLVTLGQLAGAARERAVAATNGRAAARRAPAGPIKRALIVGVNRYAEPGGNLKGCVNDALMISELAAARYGFDRDHVRMLIDERATTRNIRERLAWLTDDVPPGSVLLFHFSGHGSQIRDRNGDELDDHLDELICPHDMDWDDPLTDDEIARYVAKVDPSVNLTIVLDCCHSGSGTRDFFVEPSSRPAPRSRYLAPPPDIGFRFAGSVEVDPGARAERTVNLRGRRVRVDRPTLREQAKRISQHAFVISGCKDDQTSADAWIDNDYHGALTYSLYHSLMQAQYRRAYADLVSDSATWLKGRMFSQDPQLSTPDVKPLCDFLQPFTPRRADDEKSSGAREEEGLDPQAKEGPRGRPSRARSGAGSR